MTAGADIARVEWLLPDGRGGGPLGDGRVARIPGVVPGDVVRIRSVREGKRAVDAEVAELLTPSPDRRDPPCPHSAACGGCDLDGLLPDARATALVRMLGRTFGVAPDEIGWTSSPSSGGRRARIKLAVEGGRLGYRAHRSHELVEIDVCRVARPEIAALHQRVADWLAADAARGEGLASVELRSDGRRAVAAFSSRGQVPGDVVEQMADLGDVALDERRVGGEPTLTLSVAGLSLRASPGSFFQVDAAVNEALVAFARDAIVARGAERVLDLYAGIGNLGLPVAHTGVPLIAVEAPGSAIEDLRHNARAHGLGVEVHAARVERLDPSRLAFDAVILDPPRAGAPGVLPRIVRNRPRTIVYVSCVPPNAARDVAKVPGYRLAAVRAFDLFPDTHHVEAVAVLERA
jgi:23S rRNA (uracil1939-C5)-methyltransferase